MARSVRGGGRRPPRKDKKEIVVWVDLGLGLRNKRRKGRREMPRGKITGLKRRERREEKSRKKIIPFYT